MADGRFRTGEKIVEYGDLMAEEHESVNEMRTDEARAASYEDALAFRGLKKRHWGKARECCVRDGVV